SYLEERADPRVDLEVTMVPPTSVAEADALLRTKHGARYLSAHSRFSASSLEGLSRDVRSAVAGWFGRAFPHGTAEISRPGSEEGRPRIEIRCEPVAYGSTQWRSLRSKPSEPAYVTPLVGFVVEVRGSVPGHDGKGEAAAWKLSIEDKTLGKMLATDFHGQQRAPLDLVEDAFAQFLEGVPAQ